MKKNLIFLAIITVVALAAVDVIDRKKDLDNIAVKTPAQVEINQDMLKPSRERTRNYTNQGNENSTKRDNQLFNERIREQNVNSTNPLEKQKNRD